MHQQEKAVTTITAENAYRKRNNPRSRTGTLGPSEDSG